MGAEEGFDDDAAEFRPPPSPDDRLWRHPAEMALARTGAAPPAPEPVALADDRHGRSLRRSPLAVGVASVVSGAVLACSVMFAAGGIGDEPDRLGLAPLATLVPGDGTDVGIVSVEVEAASGSRTASALVLRDGTHVVTSAQVVPEAAAGASGSTTAAVSSAVRRDPTTIRIVDEQGVVHRGTVVAIDRANDLAIVRTDGDPLTPYDTSRTATITAGDEVTLDGGGYGAGLRRWRSTAGEAATAYHGDNVDLVGVALLADPLPAAATGAVSVDADGALTGLVVVDLRRGSTGGATRLPAVVVPIERVLRVADQFLTTGTISHAWLGVEGTPDLDTTRQVARRAGATVEHVVPGSPAGLAGLREGDILTRVCDATVVSIDDVVHRLLELEPDVPCGLDVVRDGTAWRTEVHRGRRAA